MNLEDLAGTLLIMVFMPYLVMTLVWLEVS